MFRCFFPDEYLDSAYGIDYEKLYKEGYRGLLFDIDNTINGLFLCSDGLTNMVTDEQIEKVLNSKSSIEEQVEKLIKKSNIRGGTDNISIAYLKKESGDK